MSVNASPERAVLIRLIGSIEVEISDVVHPLNAPKIACVLATLAENPGEPVDLSTLLTRVWGASPPDSAISVLYSYIARLRAIFRTSESVTLRRAGKQGYILDIDRDDVDVHVFRRLARQAMELTKLGDHRGALPLWREADELARGEALVGIDGDWATRYRARFRRERLQLLATRFDAELKLGHHNAVVGEIAEAVAREPLAEPFAEHLMLALYRCGRPAEALDQYEVIRIGLRDRLGADPSPRLKSLHRRILHQDPSLSVEVADTAAPTHSATVRPVPAQLPPAPTSFLGREAELAAIMSKRAHHPVIVIDGMAGIGKTALALHTAHKLAPEYPDGQLFIDLRGYADGVAPLAADDALSETLRSLDVEVPDEGGARSAALRTALAGRRVLLVLDNARDAGQVLPLLPGSSQCLTIVTSRRRMVDLVEARPISLDTLSATEAAEVFSAEADRGPVDEVLVEQIAAACGHLPIALRIAASRLRNRRTWTMKDLLRRLTDDHTRLPSLDPAGSGGMTAAFDLSYLDFAADERRLFRLLSVFPGSSFDGLVAAVLADMDTNDATDILERLVDAHLVIPAGPNRYRLHDLLRRYAAALVDSTERDEAWQRLVDLHVSRARIATDLVHPNFDGADGPDTSGTGFQDAGDARRWFHDELSTIVNIIDREIELQNHQAVADLCASTTLYLMHHQLHALRRSLAQKGATASRAVGNPVRVSRFEHQLALACSQLGLFDAALHHFEQALVPGDTDYWYVSHVTNNIGVTYSDQGDSRRAADQYRAAARIAAEHDFAGGEALALCNLGEALERLGEYDEAAASLDRSEEIVRKQGNQLELMRVHYNRGLISLAVGDYAAASKRFNLVLDYCREHHEITGELASLSGLTDLAHLQGEFEHAVALALQQLGLTSSSEPLIEIEALTQLGKAQARLGELDSAAESLRAALTLATEFGAARLLARAQHALGGFLLQQGAVDEAVDLLTSAGEFFESGGYPQAEDVKQLMAESSADD